MPTLALALQLLLAQPAGPPPRPMAGVDSAARAHIAAWARAWRLSQRDWSNTQDALVENARMRTQAVHCHFTSGSPRITPHMITGTARAHASCPVWYEHYEPIEDERLHLDGALDVSLRDDIGASRSALRERLDSAARALPGNARIAAYRVRFALEAGDTAAAARAAASCTEHPVDCSQLVGFVHYRAGRIAPADSTFIASAAAMPPVERCAWQDLRMLLERAQRDRYGRLDCAQRAAFNEKLWWLADPMWLEPGNERRAEHYARKVQVRLLASLGSDGRHHFELPRGGEAVVETLLRYGWPAHVHWGGPRTDVSHTGWLLDQHAVHAEPYVVREYPRDRLHTVPAPAALDSPFSATPEHWDLNGPAGDYSWWPVEHYARDRGGIGALPLGQDVMLRRAAAVRYVLATRGDSTVATRAATLFDSRAPDSLVSAHRVLPDHTGRLLLQATLAPGPTLVGIEIPGDPAHPAARTRYGLVVPGTLAELNGARDLSQPLLFESIDEPVDADDAIARMYDRTTFRTGMRLGVYWEGYGFAADDTVDVEIRVTREDRPGLLTRAFAAVGLAGDGDVDLALRWTDVPGTARARIRSEAGVPIQMRDVTLDVSRLNPGSYRLSVSMAAQGSQPVRAERRFAVRR